MTNRSFNGIDTTGLSVCKPLVVPFAFFANTSVQKDGATITGLSRMQAVQIFSAQAYDWSDFGATYTAQPIVACLRHAGSGTHATIDKAVMNPAWGGELLTTEQAPTVYFNDGSSDMVNCVKLTGAIGYADADQSAAGAIDRLKYNGFYPNYATIKDGEYDNFWSLQNLYYHGPDALIESLCNYAGDPANLPVAKAPYWAAACEMTFMKEHDWLYPGYVGSTCERPENLKIIPNPAL
jgi:ABC-type phosphate transport system substrate-binding protein